jgi:Tol biopolymer transport system component
MTEAYVTSSRPVHQHGGLLRLSAVLLAVLSTSCSSDQGCAAGNPLMPRCSTDMGPSPEPAIVFQSSARHGNLEIYRINSDGSALRRLTDSPGNDIMARWSPDGSRIVFASIRGGATRELYLMDSDGGNVTRLTTMPGQLPGYPDWSPDGTRIVFHAARGDGNFDIYIINADGTGLTRVTSSESYLRPRWSPDGARIVTTWYQTTAPGTCCSRLAVMNVDGSDHRVLTYGSMQDFFPEWSPDGRQVAFTRYHQLGDGMMGFQVLAVINADGTGERSLGLHTMGAAGLSWSRSTGRIHFHSDAPTGFAQVYSIRPDGTDMRRITVILGNDLEPHAR